MNQNETVTVSLHVNGKPVEDELERLRKKLREIKDAKDKAFVMGDMKKYRELELDMKRVEQQAARIEGNHRALNKTLNNLSTSKPKELRAAIRALNAELNSPEVERGSEQWKRVTAQISAAKEELKKISEESRAAKDLMGKSAEDSRMKWANIIVMFRGVVDTAKDVFSAFGSAQAAVQGYIDDYAAMEEEMAGVRKYTGLTADEVRALNEDFKRMDTRTSREQLNALAGDAGRLGITSRQEILDFVEAADMINVALGEDLGEDAVKNIGKLADVFGDKDRMGLKQAMLATGSAINELAQSSSASEPYILDFTARLAATGKTAGLTQAQIMGLASGFDQSKMDCEKAATALTKVFTRLMQDPAKAARVAGMEVEKFTRLVRTDANAALMAFAQGLSRYDKVGMTQALTDLKVTGAGVSDALKLLATDTDRFRQAQELAAKAFREGTSVGKEFAVQNNTVQAGLDKARKRLHDVSVELGERLMPVAMGLNTVAAGFAELLSTLVKFATEHTFTVIALSAAVARLVLAQKAATAWTKALTAAKLLWRGATLALQAALSPLRLVTAAVASAVRLAATAMRAHTVATRAAALATEQFNKAMKKNVIGLALAALATAIAYWWDYASAQKAAAKAQGENMEKMSALQRVQKKADDSTQQEITRIGRLTEIIRNNAYSYDTKKRALMALEKIVPGFHANLRGELRLTRENTKAIGQYIKQIGAKARAEAYYEELVEMEKKIAAARRKKAAKDFNVEAVNAELARNPERYKSKPKTIYYSHTLGGGSYTYESNKARTDKMEELTTQTKAAADAQQELNDALRERNALQRQMTADTDAMTFYDKLVISGTTLSGGTGGDDTGYTPAGDDEDSKRKAEARRRAKVVEDRERREKAKAATQFAAGEIKTWEDYQTRLLRIEEQSVEDRRKLWRKGDTELLDLDRELSEARQKAAEGRAAWSLKQIDAETEAEKRKEETRYLRGETTGAEHQAALDRIALDGLRRRRDYLRKYSGKPEDIQAAEEALAAEETRQATERERTRLEAIKSLKEQYLKLSAEEQYRRELDALDALYPEALRKTEEYLRLRRALEEKYRGTDGTGGEIGEERRRKAQEALALARKIARGGRDDEDGDRRTSAGDGWGGAFAGVVQSVSAIRQAEETYARLRELREQDRISVEQYNDACAELDKGRFDRLQAVAQAAYAAVTAVMQSASQLMQANAALEEAKVTRRYDAEIKKAGENTARGKKLEEQKQKELAKIKSKYNKKAMAVELAQAVASTAMNALMAYGAVLQPHQPWTVPLAIAAAAAATAAGMMQVAAIKKQHEAQAAGYYGGGFTGGTDYRREAGVVHQGEFVANHAAVRNPAVLPVLRLIDHAQRTNTVASLTAEDVSRAVSAPQTAARAATLTADAASASGPVRPEVHVEVVDTAQPRTAEAIERLAQRLEEGIESYVVLDGPDGLHRKYERYRRLLSRK